MAKVGITFVEPHLEYAARFHQSWLDLSRVAFRRGWSKPRAPGLLYFGLFESSGSHSSRARVVRPLKYAND